MRAVISAYNQAIDPFKNKVDELFTLLESCLKELTYKIWHNTVVFFDDGNPLYGYSLKKSWFRVDVLEWSRFYV